MGLFKKQNDLWDLPSSFTDFFDTDDFSEKRLVRRNIPAANINETEKDYTIEVVAPGLSKTDFDVSVNNGIINISAEHEDKSEETDKNYSRKEFNYQSFRRSFRLPESINEEDVSAKYKDGILQLTIEKKEPTFKASSRSIEIK